MDNTVDVLYYNRLDLSAIQYIRELELIQTKLNKLQDELSSLENKIKRKQSSLTKKEELITRLGKELTKLIDQYPNGLPDNIYYDANIKQKTIQTKASVYDIEYKEYKQLFTSYEGKRTKYEKYYSETYLSKWKAFERCSCSRYSK